MKSILTSIDGYKTYIGVATCVALVVAGYGFGFITPEQVQPLFDTALVATIAALRMAISKVQG